MCYDQRVREDGAGSKETSRNAVARIQARSDGVQRVPVEMVKMAGIWISLLESTNRLADRLNVGCERKK